MTGVRRTTFAKCARQAARSADLAEMQAVGEWAGPTSRVLPGCPVATFVMTIVLERWKNFTIVVGTNTWVRG